MVTRKNRSRHKKTRKQRGGLKCDDQPTWTPFKWSANSCWLDSFLLALLHHPNKEIDSIIRKAYKKLRKQLKTNNSDILKKNKIIVDKLLYIRSHLRNDFEEPFNERDSEEDLVKHREELRNTIATCPGGSIFRRGAFSSISEIWQFMVKLLDIPETIVFDETVGNLPQIEAKQTYIGFSGFDLKDEDKLNNGKLNIINYLTKTQYDLTRIYKYKQFGDLLPIDIERMAGFEENTHGLTTTPIIAQEYMDLQTGTNTMSRYRLVSVICNTGGHYVSYISCDEGDEWMFYNDMGRNEDDRIIPVGIFDKWWKRPIPGTKKLPANYSTWLLYIKE